MPFFLLHLHALKSFILCFLYSLWLTIQPLLSILGEGFWSHFGETFTTNNPLSFIKHHVSICLEPCFFPFESLRYVLYKQYNQRGLYLVNFVDFLVSLCRKKCKCIERNANVLKVLLPKSKYYLQSNSSFCCFSGNNCQCRSVYMQMEFWDTSAKRKPLKKS